MHGGRDAVFFYRINLLAVSTASHFPGCVVNPFPLWILLLKKRKIKEIKKGRQETRSVEVDDNRQGGMCWITIVP